MGDCFLFDQDPDADEDVCECGHPVEHHATAPGGHPGECEAEL